MKGKGKGASANSKSQWRNSSKELIVAQPRVAHQSSTRSSPSCKKGKLYREVSGEFLNHQRASQSQTLGGVIS